MKHLLLLISTVLSQYNDPARTSNPTMEMTLSLIKSRFPKRLVEKMLQNYGCHCFPGQSRPSGGMGPAVDSKDRLCLDLSHCHKCIELEHKGRCDPYFSNYQYSINNNTVNCENNNDPCLQNLCECDKHFAEKMASSWSDKFNRFYWLNPRNVDSGNTFNFREVCVPKAGIHTPDACCGGAIFHEKRPFDSGVWSCCGETGKLYDHGLQECCEDGRVVYFGGC